MLSIKLPDTVKPAFILNVLIIFIVGATLTTSNIFVYASLTPFLLFIQCSTFFILFLGLICLFKNDTAIHFNTNLIPVLLLGIYILINGLFINKGINSYHTYLLSGCGLFICLSLLIKISSNRVNHILLIITLLALLQALICLGQCLGMLKSQSHFFKVTGTWENPNITAMFIVMAVPAFFATTKSRAKFNKGAAWCTFAVLVLSLIILNCRTAWIGLVILLVIYLSRRYNLLSRLKTIKKSGLAIIGICLLGITVFAGNQLYRYKQASADGRLLIWKISTRMIGDKPLTGFGYGAFEREYNLYQANYFKHQQATATEKANAAYVHMAYNELLQNTVEGGIVGMALLAAVFYGLLTLPVFKKHDGKNPQDEACLAAYCGVIIFMAMSLLNFTIQAIPVMAVFIIYGSILTAAPYQRQLFIIPAYSNNPGWFKAGKFSKLQAMGCLIVLIGLWLAVSSARLIKASYLTKQAAITANSGDGHNAVQLLEPLAGVLNNYESYWTVYGNVLLKQKDYANSLLKYKQALLFTSGPDIYLKTGICYEQLGDEENALKCYQQSASLDLHKIEPRFAQMRLYLKVNDTVNAVHFANEIVAMPVKVASKRAYYYQRQAMLLLKTKPNL